MSSMTKITRITIFLVMIICCIIIINDKIVYAKLQDPEFVGTEKTILAQKFTTPSGNLDKSFTVSGLKPFLYDQSNQFNAIYDVTVKWDGAAVAAAYVPAILEIYKSTNPNYDGEIISKRPTLVGLSAVFRGSYHSGSIGDTEWTDEYKLHYGKLYLHIAIQEKPYEYTVTVFVKEYDEYEIKTSAWLKARAGISAQLKLLDFVDASLELASVEAGVKATITQVQRVETGYYATVKFSIPVYKIAINYQAYVNVTEIYAARSSGDNPIPTSRGVIEPTDNTYMEIRRYTLNSAGTYVAYSDYIDMEPYTGYHEFDGGGTTGLIVFKQ
ncbi:MAG: hypothetical protein ABWW65_00735 [Thermoprotei archaeon]